MFNKINEDMKNLQMYPKKTLIAKLYKYVTLGHEIRN